MSVGKSCRDIGEPEPGYTELKELSEIPVADSTYEVRYKAYVYVEGRERGHPWISETGWY